MASGATVTEADDTIWLLGGVISELNTLVADSKLGRRFQRWQKYTVKKYSFEQKS